MQHLFHKATGDIRIDALLFTNQFLSAGVLPGTSIDISYAFAERPPLSTEVNYDASVYGGFRPLAPDHRAMVRELLDYIETQVGIRFNEVAERDDAIMSFALYGERAGENYAGYAQYHWREAGGSHSSNDIYLNHSALAIDEEPYSYQVQDVVLHEIGHVLGLKHPGHYHDYEEGPFLPDEWDTRENSVMSYSSTGDATFGTFDLLALHYLYGATYEPLGHQAITLSNDMSVLRAGVTDDYIVVDVAHHQENSVYLSGNWGNDWVDVRLSDSQGPFYLTFDGGPGVDHAKLDIRFDDAHTFVLSETNHARVDVLNQHWLSVDLRHTERLHFEDRSLALDIDDGAGDMFRLYQAAFDRQADTEGLGYWIHRHDEGAALLDIALGFLQSSEFTNRHGEASNDTTFIDALYLNVLGRPGESAGVDYWLETLESGATQRHNVLVNFSESAENRANLADDISQGIIYTPWEMVEIA